MGPVEGTAEAFLDRTVPVRIETESEFDPPGEVLFSARPALQTFVVILAGRAARADIASRRSRTALSPARTAPRSTAVAAGTAGTGVRLRTSTSYSAGSAITRPAYRVGAVTPVTPTGARSPSWIPRQHLDGRFQHSGTVPRPWAGGSSPSGCSSGGQPGSPPAVTIVCQEVLVECASRLSSPGRLRRVRSRRRTGCRGGRRTRSGRRHEGTRSARPARAVPPVGLTAAAGGLRGWSARRSRNELPP